MFIVTGNDKKWAEIDAILKPTGLNYSRANIDLDEIQGTADEVARYKARQAAWTLQQCAVVEDVSLSFAAFKPLELPGPFIKWFIATNPNDPSLSIERQRFLNAQRLCQVLDAFPDRSATATCIFALCTKIPENRAAVHGNVGDDVVLFKGSVPGTIANAPRGSLEFGWDPIFIPSGQPLTYAEMSSQEKNQISHRSLALSQFSKSAHCYN